MNKTVAETRAFVRELRGLPLPQDVDLAIAPPFTALAAAHEELTGSSIALGAQDMDEHERGPFTGEISPPMLLELGVTFVILGHSERRLHFGESDESVGRKVRAALAHGLTPIVAVGENAELHAAGRAVEHCTRQLHAAFEGVAVDEIARCVVAYEPIWAIGTGLSEDPVSASVAIGRLRACVDGLAGARFLYGGSMNVANAAALMSQPEIDGGLVGGASLDPRSFAEIAAAARPTAASR
jgi:triosephosphate isomerase